MKKQIEKIIQKLNLKCYPIKTLILVFAVAAILSIGGTLAVYTYQSYVKGVAATNESEILFVSNNLRQIQGTNENAMNLDNIIQNVVASGSDEKIIRFYIRNYQGSNTNKKQINYALRITPSIAGNYTLSYTAGSQPSSQNFNETGANVSGLYMTAGKQTQHSFAISMPANSFNNNVTFKVTAIPIDSMTTNGYSLGATLKPVNESTDVGKASVTCIGSFTDSNSEKSPYEFDAFNYAVAVANAGEDGIQVKLTWDSTYLNLDPFVVSDKEVTSDAAEDNKKSITVNVKNGSYLLKFYRNSAKSKADLENTDKWQSSWNEIAKYVTVTKVE